MRYPRILQCSLCLKVICCWYLSSKKNEAPTCACCGPEVSRTSHLGLFSEAVEEACTPPANHFK